MDLWQNRAIWSRRFRVHWEHIPKGMDVSAGILNLPITSLSDDNYNFNDQVVCYKSSSINYTIYSQFLCKYCATHWFWSSFSLTKTCLHMLFPLLLCSLWFEQVIGYIMVWRSYLLVYTIHKLVDTWMSGPPDTQTAADNDNTRRHRVKMIREKLRMWEH